MTQPFLALAAVLQARVKARSGYEPRSEGWWQLLLRQAQDERDEARKAGRPRRPGFPEPGPAGQAGWLLDEVTDPFALEVHRPVHLDEVSPGLPDLPEYVPRDHDAELARRVRLALAGHSTVAVLVGGSSAGKTRACWEVLKLLRGQAPVWRLWHPISPSRPEAALDDLARIGPRTVVWLNEAQEYLGAPGELGERVAAGLRELLRDPSRGPVLVLATLWPSYWHELTTRPGERADPHAQARELLDGQGIPVPDAFALASLQRLAQDGDPRLKAAAAGAEDGQVTQFLAGAPELLARYRTAPPAARALIHAAMDARRLGMRQAIPLAFLEAAAPGYLTAKEWDEADEDWLERALFYTATPCKGVRGPLTRIRSFPDAASTEPSGAQAYRLADYLHQHGRAIRAIDIPPPRFWAAAAAHATPADQSAIGDAAHAWGLYRDAAQLHKNATAAGNVRSAWYFTRPRDSLRGDSRPALWAASHTSVSNPHDVAILLSNLSLEGDHEPAAVLAARAAAHADPNDPFDVAMLLVGLPLAGAREHVTELATRAAAHASLSNPRGVATLLKIMQEMGADEQVTGLADRAVSHADLGDPGGVADLLSDLWLADAREQVAALLARDPATHASLGNPRGVATLLYVVRDVLRDAGADGQMAALLARDPASHVDLSDPRDVARLLDVLREAGADGQMAALLARDPATHASLSNAGGVATLLDALRDAGAEEQVAALATRAAAHASLSDPSGVARLLGRLRNAGADEQATALAGRVVSHADLGDPGGVATLLDALRDAGAEEQVAALAARAAAHASLSDPRGVARLLGSLTKAAAEEQVVELLARDPAAHADVNAPHGAAILLDVLREAGAEEQVAVLATRAAVHASLGDPRGVAGLLDVLRRAGAEEQVAMLLARDPAGHAILSHPSDAAVLLGRLRNAGADGQAKALVGRLPTAGLFTLFLKEEGLQDRFPFGREADGSPAGPWGWDDLA